MARKPPLLPAETLRRVVRTAKFDGTGILVISGAFALASASVHDVTGAEVGLLVAAAGAMELHGAGLIRNGERRGTDWLVASQLFLLAIILGYVGWRLQRMDIAPMRALLTGEARYWSTAHAAAASFVPYLATTIPGLWYDVRGANGELVNAPVPAST